MPRAMNKQDFVPPIFGSGPSLEDGKALAAWLAKMQDGQTTVKLPFTVWRGDHGEVKTAAIGRHANVPKDVYRLSDGALGIPLVERLRHLQPDQAPIVVWLSGRFGDRFPMPSANNKTPVFSVTAVHEKATAEKLYVESERGDACLAVRLMRDIHCARGSKRCEKCQAAEALPAKAKLLDVCPYGDYARPTVKVVRGGKDEYRVFEVLQVFASEDEARAFATKHALSDVMLGNEAE